MMFRRYCLRFCSVSLLPVLLWLAGVSGASASPQPRVWEIGGVKREALVHVPAPSAGGSPIPLIFAFHGHGGTMRQAARVFPWHELWPEAVCVWMQGLPTPGHLTDPDGRLPGWQRERGDQGDRDLQFFDTVLAALRKENRIDPARIHVTGHSNGGAFTYLLGAERGSVFASLAPSGAAAFRPIVRMDPKPVFHIAGREDSLVKFAWQERTVTVLLRRQQCGEGKPVAGRADLLEYTSPLQAPVRTWFHSGGHEFPPEAPALILEFFRTHPRIPDKTP